jgi:hypothetical protein
MSTLQSTNLKNPSSASNNLVLNVDGSVALDSVAPTSFASIAQMGGVTTTATATSGATTITVASGAGVNNGDFVVGQGITRGTTVSSGGGGTSIILSAAIGATLSSAPVSFYAANKPVSPGLVAGQLCRAWVNFNGTGTVAIRASYNVSSITDNGGVGDYTVNFTTPMVDANYAATMSLAPNGYPSPTTVVTSLTTAGFRFTSQGVSAGSGVSGDSATLCVVIFR